MSEVHNERVKLGDNSLEDDFAAYQTDAQTTPAEQENILSKITRLVNEAKDAAKRVAGAQEDLKKAQDHWRNMVEHQIPDAMAEAKQAKLKTTDGDDVEVIEKLYASIPKPNLPKALKWLVDHQQGAIIKRVIELGFGKEQDKDAARCLEVILEAGFTPQDTQSVHPQTLATTLVQMINAGQEVDMPLLGAYVRKEAKIKGIKVKKSDT